MKDIEKIKHDGAVHALKKRIHYLIFELTAEKWDNIETDSRFIKLGNVIHDSVLTPEAETY